MILTTKQLELIDRVTGKGGPGSGNFNHEGRPGEVGGSGEGGGLARGKLEERFIEGKFRGWGTPGSVFHGSTIESVADDIKKNGLLDTSRAKAGKVWTTTDAVQAFQYGIARANIAGQDKVIIAEIDDKYVSKSEESSDERYRIADNGVPPAGIRAVHVYDIGAVRRWLDGKGDAVTDPPFPITSKFIKQRVFLFVLDPTKTTSNRKSLKSQSIQPSGGSNPPLTADEIAFRDKLSPVVFAQLEGAFKRVLDGAKPSEVMPTNKAEDKKIVDAVRDIWFVLFKKGGDEGLQNIRRFPKASKGMNWFTKKMMDEAEEVNIKAVRPQLVIPEWVEDPEVLAAIERELFKFAHSINQTTADRLRQVMLDGMENGLPIRSIANTISDITEEWVEGSHAEMIARTETARAYTEGRTEAWKSTGVVERKIWHAAGDACPFCLEMDGRAISLDETFFDEGDSMSASWRGHELNMDFGYSDVKGPPLHPNCRCVLLAELSEKGEKIFRVLKGGSTDNEDGVWRTIRGTPIFIRDGQSMDDAIKERFGDKESSSSSDKPGFSAQYVEKDKKWTTSDGKALPEHIAKIPIPPAWTEVTFNPDPNGDLLVRGKDSKGRVQSVYSEAHWNKAAAVKFARTKEILGKWEAIKTENSSNKKTSAYKEDAECVELIMSTGIRPGSTKDTGAEKKAYGATTLEGRHVVEKSGGVHLMFVGKKGVDLDIKIEDKTVADMIKRRAKVAGAKGKLFATTQDDLLAYTHKLDGGKMKTKDFRTAVGTKTAINAIKGMGAPKTFAEYKKSVREVAKVVSFRLGNTPTIALQSYIDPTVFSGWQKPEWKERK